MFHLIFLIPFTSCRIYVTTEGSLGQFSQGSNGHLLPIQNIQAKDGSRVEKCYRPLEEKHEKCPQVFPQCCCSVLPRYPRNMSIGYSPLKYFIKELFNLTIFCVSLLMGKDLMHPLTMKRNHPEPSKKGSGPNQAYSWLCLALVLTCILVRSKHFLVTLVGSKELLN